MKILVTGGAGYIAAHTNVLLQNAGHEVIVVDNLSNSKYEAIRRVEKITGKSIKFYEIDLLDYAGLLNVFEKEKPEAVIHFAGLKAVGESCMIPLRYFENNLTGTINLIRCMDKCNVKKMVFSSSATVYGLPESVPISETAPLSVLNPYGRTKLMIEDMLRDIYAADKEWNIILLRYFNPIGAHESGEIGEDPKGIPNNLVPFIAKVATGSLEKVNVYGNDYPTPDGTGIRDYIHVMDLSEGHLKALNKLFSNPGIEVYNIGTGRGYSVLEMIRSYEKACGKKIPYVIADRRPGDAPECYADTAKAQKELGFIAVRNVDQMCEDSYRWQSKYPNGYSIVNEDIVKDKSIIEDNAVNVIEVNEVEVNTVKVNASETNTVKQSIDEANIVRVSNDIEEIATVSKADMSSLKFIQDSEDWGKNYRWYEKAVFYHIYPLGMCGADKQNDKTSAPSDKLKKLIDYIPHMQKLYISGLYIGPLFESEGHGYETIDYYMVDRRLGSNEDFKGFVEKCHTAGIKVVVDGVFNHTGRGFFAFKDLKEKREASKYINWYCNVNFRNNNEFNDNFSYDAWRGYNILPKFNLKNQEVVNYLKEAIRFWVTEFDIDGIRLDTADVLDFDFMKELRKLSNEVKQDFWLMGEVIHGDYSRWVNSDVLHSVTNYELHKGLYSGHNDHNYFEIAHTVRRLFDNIGGVVKGQRLYTFVENQDVDRLFNKLNNKKHMKNVYMLIFSLPGIPSIYYGGEFGMEGRHVNGSDDGIRPRLELSEHSTDAALFKDIAWMAKAHSMYQPFTGGEYKELILTNRQYAYARIMPEEAVIVLLNNDDKKAEMTVELPFGSKGIDIETGMMVQGIDKRIKVDIDACDGKMIYVNVNL